ncbi:PQ loop repeat protein [Coprinopsis cinerea AmutBmut pab1-1]|nr:PQ loop repeat protein [Coprinopsis cinerea AmutBmut pab1-1]
MPPSNTVAENVFGTLGTVCWTGQLIPQIWKSWRDKSTTGLSEWLMLLWGFSSVFQGAYVIVQKINIPLMVQPQLFGFLSFVSWGQCQYYGHQRTRKVALFVTAAVVLLSAILELALVLAVRPIKNDHTKDMILQFCGIFASILIAVALFPQYWEIYKLKAVIGISLVFISIDILGGVFNDLSLVFKEEFDVIAACQYTVVVVLDSVIILAAGFFKVKDWRNRGSISARDDKTQQQTCRVEDLHSRTLSTADTTLSVSRLPSFHQAEVQVGVGRDWNYRCAHGACLIPNT